MGSSLLLWQQRSRLWLNNRLILTVSKCIHITAPIYNTKRLNKLTKTTKDLPRRTRTLWLDRIQSQDTSTPATVWNSCTAGYYRIAKLKVLQRLFKNSSSRLTTRSWKNFQTHPFESFVKPQKDFWKYQQQWKQEKSWPTVYNSTTSFPSLLATHSI